MRVLGFLWRTLKALWLWLLYLAGALQDSPGVIVLGFLLGLMLTGYAAYNYLTRSSQAPQTSAGQYVPPAPPMPQPQGPGPVVTAPPPAGPLKPSPVPSYPQPVVRKIPPHLLPPLPAEIPAPRFATVPDNSADSPPLPRRLNLD